MMKEAEAQATRGHEPWSASRWEKQGKTLPWGLLKECRPINILVLSFISCFDF